MQVSLSKKINTAPYETLGFEITISSEELGPGIEFKDVHLRAYKELLAFQVFHNALTKEDAKKEYARFKSFYDIE